jgi:acetyltransferase-like isoleucine patch superfamily enzyme
MFHRFNFNFDFFAMISWYKWIIKNRIRIIIFNKLIHLCCYLKGVRIGEKVIFNGFPDIYRYKKSRIVIGKNCTLNSAKNSVLINLLHPCTLITLKQNAEIILGNNVGLSGSVVIAATKIEIGNNVKIGVDCTILDTDFHHSSPYRRITDNPLPTRAIIIEENVFIGANCIILKGITIGKNSAIGAGSVVITDIPDNSIAIGNPCKVVIRKKEE